MPGLVPVRPQHAGAQVVGHDLSRHAAEELQRAHVRADPVRQALASSSPRRRCSSTRPAPRRTPAPGAVRRCCRPPPPPCARRSRRTAARRPDAPVAWSATAGLPSRGRVRTSGCSRNRRDGRPGIPPRAAAASRRDGAVRDGSPSSPARPCAACPAWSRQAARTAAPPGPASVSVAGSGQVSPAAATRSRHSRTVLRATLDRHRDRAVGGAALDTSVAGSHARVASTLSRPASVPLSP